MRKFKKAACILAAVMMILSLGRMAASPASQTDILPTAVKSNAKQANYYAYIPDHSIYFVDAGSDYDWAYREIDYLAGGGVVSGGSNHLFYPSKAITRADFMVMLYRAYDMSAYKGDASFSDVPADAYYADAVSAAKTLGIAAGNSGKFSPEAKMTREDAMVFLKRTLDLTGVRFAPGDLSAYADADEVSDYAVEAIAALAKAGMISGGTDGRLNPGGQITRAEMAVFLYRAIHLSDEGVYVKEPALTNLCIGDTIYTDVCIEDYDPAQTYSGLVRCVTFYQTAEGYFIRLGGTAEIDQQVTYENGVLTVDGEEKELAENVVCVDVSPYSTLDEPVSTGGKYKAARVAELDGLVTEIYYIE